MKKAIVLSIFILVCGICFAGDGFGGIRKVRGIIVKIIDAETGKPLPNICVYYELEKAKPIFFVEVEYASVVKQKLLTDSNGCVFIKDRLVFLGLFQRVFAESLYINIDVIYDSEKKFYQLRHYMHDYVWDNRKKNVAFPNQKYYPAFVYSYSSSDGRVLVQKSDNKNENKRFIRYPAVSNLLEKDDITVTIGLVRREDAGVLEDTEVTDTILQ